MKRVLLKRLLLAVLLFTPAAYAEQRVDYLNLGATLLKDGYTQRAKEVLEKVDVTESGFDFARYYSLKGILLHKMSYPTLSNIFFDASISHGQEQTSVLLYKARNYWQLLDYPKVIESLNAAGDAAKEKPSLLVIKAEAYKRQDLYEEAWAVLDEGIALFPKEAVFLRQKFYYLLDLGFYGPALDYGRKYLSAGNYSAKDYLAVAYTLREKGQLDDAAALLEQALLRYEGDPKITELLGQVYIDQGNYTMAALVYDWAALSDNSFSLKAAKLYLKASQPIRSLQINRRVLDQKEKFRQRVGIDIHLDDYESLVAKVPALKRYDLIKEDDIAYAVGYGYYVNGDYANAKRYLQQISDSRLFGKATRIFQQIEKCQNDPLECY